MRQLMINREFWKGRRVFLTGHTGFKGAWLTMWLHHLGAQVAGYALKAPTTPSLYELCSVSSLIETEHHADVRDLECLNKAVQEFQPEIIFHLAAQSLVQESYQTPVDTYSTNIMGTVHVLESIRLSKCVKAAIMVTSDKCYENKEWIWGYRENDRLGGFDPYSNSKACAELVTSAYNQSFFNGDTPAIASVRAGNVIGGGDWAENRLIPDCIRAFLKSEKVILRNPSAIRPWQHVLEPLSGYLLLAEHLLNDGERFCGAWNFGPGDEGVRPVSWIAETLAELWFEPAHCSYDSDLTLGHETTCLKLSSGKAREQLHWKPRWDVEVAIKKIIDWTQEFRNEENMLSYSTQQIKEYME